jgi:hypothetical protein
VGLLTLAGLKTEEGRMEKSFESRGLRRLAGLALTVALMVSFIPFLATQADAALKGRLYKGDRVKVKLGSPIAADTVKTNMRFHAEVAEQFTKGEDVYIYQGDPVIATVESVKKPGWYGRAGELVIRFDSTMSTGGTFIPLKGKVIEKGKSRRMWACIFFFVGWAINGKNAQAGPDDIHVAEVDVADYIEIDFKP